MDAPTRQEVRSLLRVEPSNTKVSGASWGRRHGAIDGVMIRALTLLRDGADAIPCLFLTPASPPPWRAVVAVHQHNDEYHLGKSEPAGIVGSGRMRYGLKLARRGIAVVIPDLVGFEERRGPWPSDREFEQFVTMNLLAEGSSLQAKHVEDVLSAISWLDSYSDVEGPFGMMGHSLGGQVTFFAAACDERISAAVMSCGFGSIESFKTMNVLHNPGWYVPDILQFGGTAAIASVFENQSALVSAGTDDVYFPLWGVRDAFTGFAPGVARLSVFDGVHGLLPTELKLSVGWLTAQLSRSP